MFSSLEEMAAHQNEFKRAQAAAAAEAAGADVDAEKAAEEEAQYLCETCTLVLPSVCHAQQHCRLEHPDS